MSHFTVAVFSKEGQTVESLLAPFDENITVERYVKYTREQLIEKSKKEIHEYATTGYYAEYLKDPVKYAAECKNENHLNYIKNEFPLRLNWTDEEHYQNEIRMYEPEEIGENGEVYSTYNPLSKWDWYQIGGRWTGLLKLKPNATTGAKGCRSLLDRSEPVPDRFDSAKVKDIDFSLDEKEYQKAIRFWELVIEGAQPESPEDEETIKWNFYKPEYYTERYDNKEQYAKAQAEINTYAVITPDGEWHSKGKMGWFGVSHESGEEARKWNKSFKETFIDTAYPEWTFTIVDCHI